MKRQDQTMTIRLFVVDDHSIVYEGLLAVLSSLSDIECVGWSMTGREALTQLKECACDVVLLDFSLPDMTGLQVMHQLAIRENAPRVILYSMYPEETHALRMLDAGAHAFLCKSSSTEELLQAIRQVAVRGSYRTSSQALALQLEGPGRQPITYEQLSKREREIFGLLTSGKTSSEISMELGVAQSTVSTHIRHIKDKLQLETVADMVRYTYEHHLNDAL